MAEALHGFDNVEFITPILIENHRGQYKFDLKIVDRLNERSALTDFNLSGYRTNGADLYKFKMRCDSALHIGLMFYVSQIGFSKEALEVADKNHIFCFSLKRFEGFTWCGDKGNLFEMPRLRKATTNKCLKKHFKDLDHLEAVQYQWQRKVLQRDVSLERRRSKSFEAQMKKISIRLENRFPQVAEKAVISMLQHFGDLLKTRNQDISSEVRVYKSKIGTIVMEIQVPDECKQETESLLKEYGSVITGNSPIDRFAIDKIEEIALVNEITIANATIENQRRILQLRDEQVEDKDKQIDTMRAQISEMIALASSQSTNISLLLRSALKEDCQTEDERKAAEMLADEIEKAANGDESTFMEETITEIGQEIKSDLKSKLKSVAKVATNTAWSKAIKTVASWLPDYFDGPDV